MKRFLLFFLLLALLVLSVGKAAAHVLLVTAVPTPGANLSKQPKEIRLIFSVPVDPASSFTLYAEGFREVTGFEVRIDPDKPEELVANPPKLDSGIYSVNWIAISVDGHPASGSYTFAVLPGAGGDFLDIAWKVAAGIAVGLGVLWAVQTNRNKGRRDELSS